MIGIAFMAFGILFAVIGTAVIIVSIKQRTEMRDCREITARIVDFEERRYRKKGAIAGWGILYAPVYEYTEFGGVKRFVSNVGSSDPAPVGTEVTLYISKSGKVYDKQDSALMLIVGIAFVVIGIFFAAMGFIFKWTLRL